MLGFSEKEKRLEEDKTKAYRDELNRGYNRGMGAYDKAEKTQQQMLDKSTAENKPWIDAGQQALSSYQSVDYNPNKFNYSSVELFKDPSYQWRLQQGVSALDKSASSRGKVLSGQQQRAINDSVATIYKSVREDAEGNLYIPSNEVSNLGSTIANKFVDYSGIETNGVALQGFTNKLGDSFSSVIHGGRSLADSISKDI